MVPKSVLCLAKSHEKCVTNGCECACHHDTDCDCFTCRIRSVGFGRVPGGSRSVKGFTSRPDDF